MKLLLSVRLSVHLLKAFLEIYPTDFSDFFFILPGYYWEFVLAHIWAVNYQN